MGLELCAGMIVRMGETHEDIVDVARKLVVDVARKLAQLQVASIPIKNFLIPIEGAQLGCPVDLTPQFCLKVLAMF